MDVRAPVRAFDRFQRRHRPLAIAVAVLRNFSDQGAGNASALIAYWGFFSIFPLLLLFTAILGFVLHSDPGARNTIVHSALSQFPIIGANPGLLKGSGVGLGVGIVGTLSAGLGVTLAVENAFNRVYAIPPRHQPNFLVSRWRGLKLLVGAGVLQVLATVAAGAVSGGFGGVLVTIAGIIVSLLLNLGLFFVVFRFLIPELIPTRELWPGIILASVGWTVLQAVGGLYIAHVVKSAGQTYGTFAAVIGLLTWLYLGARIVVYAAEINVVLTRRLWPRSIMDPPEPADRKARAALAKMEERDDTETIDVSFHPPDRESPPDPENPPFTVVSERGAREATHAPHVPPVAAALDRLTLVELLDVLRPRLDELEAEPAQRQAREWIDRTRAIAAQAEPTSPRPPAPASET